MKKIGKKKSVLLVLDHNVLVGHQSVHSVMPPLPPVIRRSLVEEQRSSLLEGQLAAGPAAVVEAGHGFERVGL